MPQGPQGEDRQADVIGCAVTVAWLSVGNMEEKLVQLSGKMRSGRVVSKARADAVTTEQRSEIARNVAGSRWA